MPAGLAREAIGRCEAGEDVVILDRTNSLLVLPITLASRRGAKTIAIGAKLSAEPDHFLIAALRKAHRMLERDSKGRPTICASPDSRHERRLLRLAFLAPQIQADILAGRQPRHVNLEALIKADIPAGWYDQVAMLRWND